MARNALLREEMPLIWENLDRPPIQVLIVQIVIRAIIVIQ